ncbi:hypothetical protein KAU11_11535, partial [Candidatus Babeliales bacterium]|nr:hypothetical protein [Candidatus Babeliales bacterium]
MLPIKTKVQAHPTYPVVVDWSNPLTRGLVGAWLFNGPKPVNLADPSNDTTIVGAVDYQPGRGYKFNGGHVTVADQAPFDLTQLSLHCFVSGESLTNLTYSPLLCKGDVSYVLRTRSVGAGADFTIYSGGWKSLTSATPSRAKPYFIGGSLGDRGQELWVDGEVTGTAAYTTCATTAYDFEIGRNSEVARQTDDTMGLSLVHNRQLSQAEHKALAIDPYQIFKPAVEQAYFTSSATNTIDVGTGTFVVTGGDVSLVNSRILNATSGAFTTTGNEVSFINSKVLNAFSGTFNTSGGDITLVTSNGFNVSSGTFTLNGGDISLVNSRVLNAASGTFNLSGGDVILSTSVDINAGTGTFTLTGGDVTLTKSKVLNALSGTFTLTGGDVDLVTINEFNAASGNFSISGSSVDFIRAMLLEAGTGNFASTDGQVSLVFQGVGAPRPGGNASAM